MGKTIGDAFFLMYNLEHSARTQLMAMATGQKLTRISAPVADYTSNQMNHPNHYVIDDLAWQAFRRWLKIV